MKSKKGRRVGHHVSLQANKAAGGSTNRLSVTSQVRAAKEPNVERIPIKEL